MAEEKKSSPLDESQKTSRRWSGYLGWAFVTIVLIWVVFPKIQRLLETEAEETRAEERQHVIPEEPSIGNPRAIVTSTEYGEVFKRPTTGTRFSPRIIVRGPKGLWMERDGDPRKTSYTPSPSDPSAKLRPVGGDNGTSWKTFRLKTDGGGDQAAAIYFD